METLKIDAPRSRWQKQDYLPTPEDIRAFCDQIQASWTEQERLARACGGKLPETAAWTPPEVHTGILRFTRFSEAS